jgi:D-arabinose 5-phosphate isomerase GutQ
MELYESVKHTLQAESQAILDALESVDMQAIEKAVDRIASCRGKIILSGCGTSAAAGKKIAHTFSCIECPALFLEPSDAVHGGLGVVQKDDIVILLSKGGATAEINNLIKPAKAKKAFVIGVTEKEDSILATESDLFLKVKVKTEADKFGLLATSSILGVIAVFDAIAIAAIEKNGFTKERFALIHPGGAVGEILTHKKLY